MKPFVVCRFHTVLYRHFPSVSAAVAMGLLSGRSQRVSVVSLFYSVKQNLGQAKERAALGYPAGTNLKSRLNQALTWTDSMFPVKKKLETSSAQQQ